MDMQIQVFSIKPDSQNVNQSQYFILVLEENNFSIKINYLVTWIGDILFFKNELWKFYHFSILIPIMV